MTNPVLDFLKKANASGGAFGSILDGQSYVTITQKAEDLGAVFIGAEKQSPPISLPEFASVRSARAYFW